MPLFCVIATEAPRTGQRKPRVFRFAAAADHAEQALAFWKASRYGDIYATGNEDKVEVDPEPYDDHVIRA